MKKIVSIPKRMRRWIPLGIVLFVAVVFVLVNVVRDHLNRNRQMLWGATFSTKYAKELGLDWKKIFTASLDDLGIRAYRIPVYWDEVQKTNSGYDFSDVDWMLNEAAKRNAKVILVVGRRVPRWPECHIPGWAQNLDQTSQERAVLNLLSAEVEHFKSFSAIEYWQVENEALVDWFGNCPTPSTKFFMNETRLVRTLDSSHPILITDSGELSTWLPAGLFADTLGISMYRVTWNQYLGYFYYPIPPSFYAERAAAYFPIIRKVIVSELQAEPWVASSTKPITEIPLSEQYQSMDINRFKTNVDFARRTGFKEVYLWGLEWWYWVREKGDSAFWDAARALYHEKK